MQVQKQCLSEFLADDFSRLDESVTKRCYQLEGKRIYLTGATGFFGRTILALLDYLHATGISFEVSALSRDPRKFLMTVPTRCERPWLRWETGDIQAPWPGAGAFDLLLHAATDTAASAHNDKLKVFDGILNGTRQAIAFCDSHQVRRLLLTGSGAQYGKIPDIWASGVPENASIACDSTQPGSAYGEAKRASELLASLYSERSGAVTVYTRCFAFVGPGLPLDGHFAIGNFIRDALADSEIVMKTPGRATRSYLYSADLACWLLILLLEGESSTGYNVGSDEGMSIHAIAGLVRQQLNPSLSITTGHADEPLDRKNYIPSIGAAQSLGLQVWTPLEMAILRTARWQRISK